MRSKYDTGILGRSSSVADKEKSSHRYDKVSFNHMVLYYDAGYFNIELNRNSKVVSNRLYKSNYFERGLLKLMYVQLTI